MSQPLLFPGFLRCRKAGLPEYIPAPRSPVGNALPPFNKNWERPSKQDLTGSICEALTGSLKEWLLVYLYNTENMAVTIEMRDMGDPQARREILAVSNTC